MQLTNGIACFIANCIRINNVLFVRKPIYILVYPGTKNGRHIVVYLIPRDPSLIHVGRGGHF